jgi:ribosome-binding protein aMBF1 (putative translation factor)
MTTQTIQSSFELFEGAAKSSQVSEVLLVSASDGKSRLVRREATLTTLNAGSCVVYQVEPVAQTTKRSSFSAFDELAAELASEELTQGPGSEALADGRRWVAEAFYGDIPTLASLRLKAGLSQRQLGERCGLEQPHISRYESGRHEPGIATAELLAMALGVSLEVFSSAWKTTRANAQLENSK